VQQKRKSINDVQKRNEDLYFHNRNHISSHQQFINFLRDHEAWEYRKNKKLESKIEEKEQKILKDLTFTPEINK